MSYRNSAAADQVVPATSFVALTAGSTEFAATRGIHCNEAGIITVDGADIGEGVDLVVLAGACYPYRITKLTAGTGVVALY